MLRYLPPPLMRQPLRATPPQRGRTGLPPLWGGTEGGGYLQNSLPDIVTLVAWPLEGLLHHAPVLRIFAAQAPDGDAADAWVGL